MFIKWLALAGGVGLMSWWFTDRLIRREWLLGSLDHPNDRSLHTLPTPRNGGIAIQSSFWLGLSMAGGIAMQQKESIAAIVSEWSAMAWILGLVWPLIIVSYWDDRKSVPVGIRFGTHMAVASALVLVNQLELEKIAIPFWGELSLGHLSVLVSVVFLVWMTNLYNFMDGMDGFAGGMTVAGGVCLAYFAFVAHEEPMAVVALLLAASSFGFLFHNFPPARIFMGDVGSIPMGFLFGALILWGCREQVFDLWVPLIIFSPFLVDATVTLLRRAFRRERIWEAHRTHYYQRVVLLGWGHRQTVLVEYALMCGCVALAFVYQYGTEWVRAAVVVAWCALLGILIGGVEWVEGVPGQRRDVS